MIEIGMSAESVAQIIAGEKTAEARLRTPKFLTLRRGDTVAIREDVWQDGELKSSTPDRVLVRVTETIFFDSFIDVFDAQDYRDFLPAAESSEAATAFYQQYYVLGQQQEHGVVAIRFGLL